MSTYVMGTMLLKEVFGVRRSTAPLEETRVILLLHFLLGFIAVVFFKVLNVMVTE